MSDLDNPVESELSEAEDDLPIRLTDRDDTIQEPVLNMAYAKQVITI